MNKYRQARPHWRYNTRARSSRIARVERLHWKGDTEVNNTKNVKVAIRAFGRIWFWISRELDRGAEADAGFDGGEFSGPINAKYQEEEYARQIAKVAARFGLDAEHLDNAVRESDDYEMECFCSRLRKLPLPAAPTYEYEKRTLRITGRCEDGRMWMMGGTCWGFAKDEAALYGPKRAAQLVEELRASTKGWMYQIEAKGE